MHATEPPAPAGNEAPTALAATTFPPGAPGAGRVGRRRIVLVHGFTQSRQSFARLATALSDAPLREGDPGAGPAEVVTVDLPGHGDSPVPRAGDSPLPGMGDGLTWTAHLLRETGGRAVYLGYSMGARPCLRLALDEPDVVEALVIVGATPGIEDPGERSARRAADEAIAARIEASGLESFLGEWLAGPLFAQLSAEQADVASRLVNTPAGLAAALRSLGPGAGEPMWDRLGELSSSRVPVLIVAGERDAKFVGIASRMMGIIGPGAHVAVIPDAGHAVPFEQPQAFLDAVRQFLVGVAR